MAKNSRIWHLQQAGHFMGGRNNSKVPIKCLELTFRKVMLLHKHCSSVYACSETSKPIKKYQTVLPTMSRIILVYGNFLCLHIVQLFDSMMRFLTFVITDIRYKLVGNTFQSQTFFIAWHDFVKKLIWTDYQQKQAANTYCGNQIFKQCARKEICI